MQEKLKKHILCMNQIYYLSENIDEMSCQKEITNPTRINYSNNFQESEIEKCIEEYNKETSPKIIESIINQISKKYLNFHNFYINDLTIQNTNVKIDHCSLKSKINVYLSTLTVFYSIFTPLEQSKTNYCIDISFKSKCYFKNCHFHNFPQNSINISNYSTALFDNCTFENNFISCCISDHSFVKFIDCKFKKDKKSIVIDNYSTAKIDNCKFQKNFNSILSFGHSKLYVTNSYFNKCQDGSISIYDSSLFLNNTKIENSNCEALLVSDSNFEVSNFTINKTKGIEISNSNGFFNDCDISDTFQSPAITVYGHLSKSIFKNITFSNNCDDDFISCFDHCQALFTGCTFIHCKKNCFRISDFAQIDIQLCTLVDIENFYISSLNNSNVRYENLIFNKNVSLLTKIQVLSNSTCQNESCRLELNLSLLKEKNKATKTDEMKRFKKSNHFTNENCNNKINQKANYKDIFSLYLINNKRNDSYFKQLNVPALFNIENLSFGKPTQKSLDIDTNEVENECTNEEEDDDDDEEEEICDEDYFDLNIKIEFNYNIMNWLNCIKGKFPKCGESCFFDYFQSEFSSFSYDMLYNCKKNLAKIVFLFNDHFKEKCGKLTLDMIRGYVEEKNLSIQKDISEKEIDNLICKIKSFGDDVDYLSIHKLEYHLLVICVYYALYDPSGPKNKMLLINNENEIYFFIYYAGLGFDNLRNIKSYLCDELNLNYD